MAQLGQGCGASTARIPQRHRSVDVCPLPTPRAAALVNQRARNDDGLQGLRDHPDLDRVVATALCGAELHGFDLHGLRPGRRGRPRHRDQGLVASDRVDDLLRRDLGRGHRGLPRDQHSIHRLGGVEADGELRDGATGPESDVGVHGQHAERPEREHVLVERTDGAHGGQLIAESGVRVAGGVDAGDRARCDRGEPSSGQCA